MQTFLVNELQWNVMITNGDSWQFPSSLLYKCNVNILFYFDFKLTGLDPLFISALYMYTASTKQ